MSPLDDLKGTKAEQCVVVRLSHNYPDLAVKVFKTNPTAYSLFILPTLVAQGINKPVVRINNGIIIIKYNMRPALGKGTYTFLHNY